MGRIICFPGTDSGIDVTAVKVSSERVKLDEGLISPASGQMESLVVNEHAGEPIKEISDINRITSYLIENKRYRDHMLFVLGINFGLRISDLLKLRFGNLIDDGFSFRGTFPILEQKTSSTRKVQKNRYITINQAVMDAVVLYLQNVPNCKLDDYLFRSESNHGSGQNKPITRKSADRILKDIAVKLELPMHISTHSLRKTFGYHQMSMSGNDPRKLLLLQKIFGHSTSAQTLDYIGITSEEIEQAYLGLNLGSKEHNYMFGTLREEVVASA